MKKLLGLLLTGIIISSFVGCAPKEEAKEQEQQAAPQDTASTVFVMGLDDSFPPMGYRDEDNNIVGFDVDLAKAVCEEAGLTLELKPIDWSAKEMELNTDKIDVIWNGFTSNPDRAEKMLMSEPYLMNRQIIVTPKDSDIKTVADLAGKNVGVQAGSTSYDTIEANEIFPQLTISEYPENVSALQDLKIGRIDALVLDEVVGRYYTSKDAESYNILEDVLAEEEYVIAFKKGNDELRSTIEEAFDKVVESGKAAEISQDWFGEDILVK